MTNKNTIMRLLMIRKGVNTYALSHERPDIFSHVLSSISFMYSVRVNLLPHSVQRNATPRQP